MAAQQGAHLERRYLVLMALITMPMLALVAVLGITQFRAQRHAILNELAQTQNEHRMELDTRIKPARDHVTTLRHMAESRLEGTVPFLPSPLRSYMRPESFRADSTMLTGSGMDWVQGTPLADRIGNIIAAGEALTKPAPSELDMALEMFEPMRLEHLVTPYLQWSYYFTASEDFISIFPFELSSKIMASVKSHDFRGAIREWLTYDVYVLGTPARNPARAAYWTTAYEDAAGAGWMVSHAAPVYATDRFIGVVGTDILLNFLQETLDQLPLPAGRAYVVDEYDNVLASTWTEAGAGVRPLAEQLPDGLEVPVADLLQVSGGFRSLGDVEARTEPLQNAPWRLLVLVAESELTALLMPRFIPYAAVMAAMVLALVLIHFFLRRQFIRPAASLIEHIKRSSDGQPSDPKTLPDGWRSWAEAVTRAFERERSLRQSLERSEAQFLAAADSMPDGLLITDAEDRIRFFNKRYPEHLAEPLRAVLALGKHFDEWIKEGVARGPVYHPDMGPDFVRRRLEIRSASQSDHEHHLADGRWVRLREQRMADGGRVLVSSDISARKQAELALQESEARYRAIVEDQTEVIARFDADFRMVFCNEASARILGIAREEALGTDLFRSVPEADRAQLRADLLSLTPERPVIHGEGYKVLPDGDVRWYFWTNRALFDPAGRLLGYQTVGSDITEHRRTQEELARQREALHQAEKLGALGSLLAGVAHELNNPLSIVVGHAEMIRELALDERTRARAEKVHEAAERCARIVRTFLSMARSQPRKPEAMQLNDIIGAALGIVSYALRTADITVEQHLQPDLPAIWGDEDQLHQVVANLLVNAQQAMQDTIPPRLIRICTRFVEGRVELEVSDNGPGIPPEIRARVFDPFFTTKPVGLGTGIGLSVSRGIVLAHEGTMEIIDRPGSGATILVSLPPAISPTTEVKAPARPAPAKLHARILVVDDEEDILEMLVETLERDGHEVATATSGRRALELLRTQSFDLILSDLRMPDLDGTALLRDLKQHRPELVSRLILMTGDVLGARLSGPAADGTVPVLEKPVQRDALRREIAARLAQSVQA